MDDYIKRWDAIKAVRELLLPEEYMPLLKNVEVRIKNAPSVQPERKPGEWKEYKSDNPMMNLFGLYECCECGFVTGTKDNYCSKCGAYMKNNAN